MSTETSNILEVYKLSMHFPVHNNILPLKKSIVKAVDEVSFSIALMQFSINFIPL